MESSRTRLGIANEETWRFFNDIYEDLKRHFRVTVFNRREFHLPVFNTRMNRLLLNRDLSRFLASADVAFFEWASGLLAAATQLPRVTRIATRLHRYEMYQWVDQIDWRKVDRVILVSEAMRKEFNGRFPEHAFKTKVISSSASLDRFRKVERVYQGDLGILCQLIPRKRVYDLILTVSEMVQEGDSLHLHIGGADHPAHEDYSRALRWIVDRLGLKDRVTFYGNVDDTPSWLGNIDVFISHSYSEGLQAAPIEAMATGCYTLVHGWSGADELVPEDCIYLSAGELKAKLRAYAAAPEEQKLRQRARMRSIACERFDAEMTKSGFREVIGELAAGRKDG